MTLIGYFFSRTPHGIRSVWRYVQLWCRNYTGLSVDPGQWSANSPSIQPTSHSGTIIIGNGGTFGGFVFRGGGDVHPLNFALSTENLNESSLNTRPFISIRKLKALDEKQNI